LRICHTIVRRLHKRRQIYFFRMSAAHDRYPASAVARARESRYTKRKTQRRRRPGSRHRTELMTMATALQASHTLPASSITGNIVDDIACDAPARAAAKPSLMRRLFDAIAESQSRRARRELERLLGPGGLEALHGQLPPRR
jgi:hypothetical protein